MQKEASVGPATASPTRSASYLSRATASPRSAYLGPTRAKDRTRCRAAAASGWEQSLRAADFRRANAVRACSNVREP